MRTALDNGLKISKPFVKWAGGKRQLIGLLLDNSPPEYKRYIEPFVGGGALLFALRPSKAIISDINPELINAYKVIRDNVNELIKSLRSHKNESEYFYDIRGLDVANLCEVEMASRFIYLNKTCYNGLYRVNSKGRFNAPFGRYKNPNIVDSENLKEISKYLNSNDIKIVCKDYKTICKMARKGDFIYFDPPYHPISKTASFTKYARGDFIENDQIELASVFSEVDKKGCFALLSNSNTKLINELYSLFNIKRISANRFINCKKELRGKTLNEVLVKNWQSIVLSQA